jgi:glycosyltransferase involved in cell wall biosynthesis
MSMKGRYCVVIPAVDAAGSIAALVRGAKAHGLGVVVIDDGSSDRTASLAAAEGALVISHLRTQGKGRALRTGFEHALRARFDGVITMDADGQHDPSDIPSLIHAAEHQHAALVLGNRLADGVIMPRPRRFANRLMSGIISAVARQPFPDSQCGFRLVRREVLESVPLRSRRYEIESELLLGASRRKWKIVSVPVRSIYNGHQSRIRPVREAVRFAGVVLRALASRD